jgi:hypothetical protein
VIPLSDFGILIPRHHYSPAQVRNLRLLSILRPLGILLMSKQPKGK